MSICLLLFAIAGCGGPDSADPITIDPDDPQAVDTVLSVAIDIDCLEWRRTSGEDRDPGLKAPFNDACFPDGRGPYTGWAKEMHEDGKIAGIYRFKDGKLDGIVAAWHENGQKWGETNYANGKADGKGVNWYSNGRKEREFFYETGELVSMTVWKPNGEECGVSEVVDGNGTVVEYEIDGTERLRMKFVDGLLKEDGG